MMSVLKVVFLFLINRIWRITGISWIGRGLVHALGSPDPNVRDVAGMFLVQADQQSEPLLKEALRRRENLPTILTVLGSMGDPEVEPELRKFSDDPDPLVSQAARDALKLMGSA
jgi:HEAT repeat protein